MIKDLKDNKKILTLISNDSLEKLSKNNEILSTPSMLKKVKNKQKI